MEKKIEILPYPGGYLVTFPLNSNAGAKQKVDKIRRVVMADLRRRGHRPRPNPVEWRDNYYFKVLTGKGEPQKLLGALKQALNRALEGGKEAK